MKRPLSIVADKVMEIDCETVGQVEPFHLHEKKSLRMKIHKAASARREC